MARPLAPPEAPRCFAALSTVQLRALLQDEPRLQRAARLSRKFQSLQLEREMCLASNSTLARENLSLRPQLEDGKASLAIKYQELQEIQEACWDKQQRLATRYPFLLICTSLLAPAALLAFDIKNLHLCNGTLDEIMNLHPESFQLDKDDKHVRQVRDIAPHSQVAHGWPKDCSEIPAGSRSGVYIIQPKGLHQLVVYCEMNVTNGGWTVIQRNQKDTAVTWAESWSTYKYGFGNVRSEYWLGTEYIHQIAKQKVYQVRFVIWDTKNNIKFADYNLFSVEDESHGYRLRLGSYTGTAGDAMTSDNPNTMHDNMKFSTKDRDQDTYSKNCAYSYEGGWWYSACYSVRLNFKGGMTWGSLCKGDCKSSLILIKPAPYC